uniref:NADH-ubiquinone oxidoreductase chain 3 n=1 Tax=Bostrichoidea sp. 1 KM-2017 TaxID=2219275 RepID=A0A346RJM7_9COLE|nr:NADH dehydrogenase subunit 3 [Bostrichoidea sp. 1 KM-2017]
MILTSMTIIIMIVMLMMTVNNIISKKSFQDREKSSPFECGFDPKSSPRMPFSIHFFLVAIIFLVFDIEISLMLPVIPMINSSSITCLSFTYGFFIIILIVGVLHEWKQGALNWTN